MYKTPIIAGIIGILIVIGAYFSGSETKVKGIEADVATTYEKIDDTHAKKVSQVEETIDVNNLTAELESLTKIRLSYIEKLNAIISDYDYKIGVKEREIATLKSHGVEYKAPVPEPEPILDTPVEAEIIH